MEENWKEIEGFRHYLVSDKARVKRLAHVKRKNYLHEKIIQSFVVGKRKCVYIVDNRGTTRLKTLSKLVANSFLGKCDYPPFFKDGNRLNCELSNLTRIGQRSPYIEYKGEKLKGKFFKGAFKCEKGKCFMEVGGEWELISRVREVA